LHCKSVPDDTTSLNSYQLLSPEPPSDKPSADPAHLQKPYMQTGLDQFHHTAQQKSKNYLSDQYLHAEQGEHKG
jgi:hypothetical protein